MGLVRLLYDILLMLLLQSYRKELGLPSQPRGIIQWMNSPQKVIGLFPDWFAKPQPDWPANTELTGFPLFDEGATAHTDLPSGLEEFLDLGEPPIIFTPGTPYKRFTDFFSKAVQATTSLGKRAIFITRFKEQLPPDLPPHIRFIEYAPFSRVFPRASVLVHHGGIGTMAQAMRAGIPQLIAPWGIDQYDNGTRMKALGIGDVISSRTCTAASLADKLDYLLHANEVHAQCRNIAMRIRTSDPLTDICRIIETQGLTADKSGPLWQSVCSEGLSPQAGRTFPD